MGLSRQTFTREFRPSALQRLEMEASVAELARAFEVNPNVLHSLLRLALPLYQERALTAASQKRSIAALFNQWQLTKEEVPMRTCNAEAIMLPAIGPSLRRRSSTIFLAIAIAVATLAVHPAAIADDKHEGGDHDQHWVATWATSPATFFHYTPPVPPVFPPGAPTTFAPANIQPDLGFPFPNANTTGATNQTFRSIVKPDLWGNRIRVRFSNVFGNQPVTFNEVTVALQEYSANVVRGTLTRVTFGGQTSVTIPAGQEIFSDGIRLSWVKDADEVDPGVQGRNLAVSYSVEGNTGPMTHHSGANMTSYMTPTGSGNHTEDLDVFAFEFTTTSWFFMDP